VTSARDLLEEAMLARRTGALVVGQGNARIYLLLGEPHHAAAEGTALSGLAAVREAGRLASLSSPVAWRSDEPLGAGRSLAGIATGEVLRALDEGADDAAPGVAAMADQAAAMVAATLHRHGRVIEAEIRASTSAEQLMNIVGALASRTVRGVRRQTMETLAEQVRREIAPP
jgi:hypothetical protein